MPAQVVIGANWGDEGKGTITHYLCARLSPIPSVFEPYPTAPILNIRFNGGAQAGHTVIARGHRRGQRHVFHHFGSGSFLDNVETFLSKFFICNPIMFATELEELRSKYVFPKVHVDIDCMITTPFDMMLNQMVEEKRGAKRHGSCGLGINETIKRDEVFPFRVRDIENIHFDRDRIKKFLIQIRERWVGSRMLNLGLISFADLDPKNPSSYQNFPISDEWKARLNDDAVLEKYLDTLEVFYTNTRVVKYFPHFLRQYQEDHLIFEGAQGLLLDQHHKFFPYVTNSNTGLKNAVALAQAAGLTSLEVTYVTRSYATRHGAGPFPHEMEDSAPLRLLDQTNVPNDWQGTIRFGLLDIDLLRETIAGDLVTSDVMNLDVGLAVTHIDAMEYMPGGFRYMDGDTEHRADTAEAFLAALEAKFEGDLLVRYTSDGPKAGDVFKMPDMPLMRAKAACA